ncbi:flagellar hook-basal body complex protein [Aliarcobacter thereius]|uniref:flagellar hook-basal body complex protein n=1 Tax=Aliarcobacter thereius TaxID=544718 RepID=UPI0010FD6A86|nr:flagellar hook-basal body complex protein [Aliarcobacter thereius]TLT08025.1 flagellar hook-basal body complex protein [Aliarcobacter thereius]
MIGALWNGVSGIYQQDKGISTEANNISNSSTVGHKKDEIHFSDLMYSQAGIGKGVQTQSVSKVFTQGQIVGTGSGIDVALEGKGFFIVRNREDDSIAYTRAGNLVQAKDGFLVTQDNFKIQGLVPQNIVIDSSDPTKQIFTDDFSKNMLSTSIIIDGVVHNINTKTTDYRYSSKTDSDDKKGDNYKTSVSKGNDVDKLQNNYQNIVQDYINNKDKPSQKRQISEIDLSTNLNNLNPIGNEISINLDGRNYTVTFDEADKEDALKELSYKISQASGFSSTYKDGILTIEQSEALGNEFKVEEIKLNNSNLEFTSNDYEIINSDNPVPTSQNSKIDFSKKFDNINSEGNKLTITIDGKTFSVEFDAKTGISEDDMNKLYEFLSEEGRAKYGLADPSTIATQDELDNILANIPSQATIDAMPTTTAAEIAAKNQAQADKDAKEIAYNEAKNRKEEQTLNYLKADTIVSALKELSDKVSNSAGCTASVKDGVLDVTSLVPGKQFSVSEISVNTDHVFDIDTINANKGWGIDTVYAARDALKSVVEVADGEFLEITSILDYSDLGSYGESDINIRLDILGIADKSLADVTISDDGFVYVTSGTNKFLVGRLSTVGFRNEQGLESIGGNLYKKSEFSGEAFNADSMNTIKGGSLERANVDYGTALTQLMVYQKAFEASSKSITTSDEFLQTAIEMKR